MTGVAIWTTRVALATPVYVLKYALPWIRQCTLWPNACLARVKSGRRLSLVKMMQNHFQYDIPLTKLFLKDIAGLYVS